MGDNNMKNKTMFAVLFILALGGNLGLTGSEVVITRSDYERAESFLSRNLSEKVYNLEVAPRWIEKGHTFWYRVNTREGKKFLFVDPDKKLKRAAFDHVRLAQVLGQRTGKTYEAGDLPFDSITYLKDNKLEFETEKIVWTLDLTSYELSSREKKAEKEKPESESPDGEWIAFARDYNLFIRSAKNGKEMQLTHNGERYFEWGSRHGWADLMEGENGDRTVNFEVRWSPDSKKLYTVILDLRRARKMYLLGSAKEGYRSKLYSYYRASPGDTDIPYYIPMIFDVENHRAVKIDLDPVPHFIGLDIRWFEDSRRLYARKFERGYKKLFVYEIDAATGQVRVAAQDENRTCIETGISRYRVLQKTGEVLLTSERDGWNHLYLYDWETGKLKKQLTKGEYVVLSIQHVDEERGGAYFTAVGKEKGEDPYLVHLYWVNFDGSALRSLTPEPAFHGISTSPDDKYFVDNYSRVDLPTRSVLRKLEDGSVVMELEQADIEDVLAVGWRFPEPFKLKAADGETDIYGLIWKPTNFDPSRKYPVIDQTYTGPQAVNAPKTFRRALLNSCTSLTELQFIMITVDGRGTARRSKKFHDFSYNNLGGGCTDHITAIKQLAEKYSYMDAERVGIYGGSAGGYDTARALLVWPDFYDVGVSASGNHDHRMAKAWWPEQYMGYPVGDFYEDQSNISQAGNLKGKLLLVHGELDENVNPSATFRLADALIKANKDFDMLIVPDSHHGFRGIYGDYVTRKRWDYFVRHLHGVEPPPFKIEPAPERR
jgi:dipeptidyl aminopeptidase/acylaminoacyl peptidase